MAALRHTGSLDALEFVLSAITGEEVRGTTVGENYEFRLRAGGVITWRPTSGAITIAGSPARKAEIKRLWSARYKTVCAITEGRTVRGDDVASARKARAWSWLERISVLVAISTSIFAAMIASRSNSQSEAALRMTQADFNGRRTLALSGDVHPDSTRVYIHLADVTTSSIHGDTIYLPRHNDRPSEEQLEDRCCWYWRIPLPNDVLLTIHTPSADTALTVRYSELSLHSVRPEITVQSLGVITPKELAQWKRQRDQSVVPVHFLNGSELKLNLSSLQQYIAAVLDSLGRHSPPFLSGRTTGTIPLLIYCEYIAEGEVHKKFQLYRLAFDATENLGRSRLNWSIDFTSANYLDTIEKQDSAMAVFDAHWTSALAQYNAGIDAQRKQDLDEISGDITRLVFLIRHVPMRTQRGNSGSAVYPIPIVLNENLTAAASIRGAFSPDLMSTFTTFQQRVREYDIRAENTIVRVRPDSVRAARRDLLKAMWPARDAAVVSGLSLLEELDGERYGRLADNPLSVLVEGDEFLVAREQDTLLLVHPTGSDCSTGHSEDRLAIRSRERLRCEIRSTTTAPTDSAPTR